MSKFRSGAAKCVLATLLPISAVVIGFSVNAAGVSSAASPVPGTVSGPKPAITPTTGLSPFTTVTGKVYMSEDGIGTNDPAGGPIYVQKNNASTTVQAAYLLAAGIPGYTMLDGDVTLDGTPLSFPTANNVVGNFGVNSVWTNVTSIVKPIVDAAPAGKVEFTAAEPNNTDSIDGEILAVILNDPTLSSNNTVSFLFGALDTTGDTFSIGLASPLNLADPNLGLTMSIGDSYSYQGDGQYSVISVNGTLMTSSAGGNDDSICKYDTPQDFSNCGNGELITVGGIGDSTANPPDPNATDLTCGPPGPPRCDDELYNLLPFVHNGDTSIKVNTDNPSANDNIFFSGFQLNSTAAVVGEGAVLTPVSGSNPVGSPYTFTAKLQTSTGAPIANQNVTLHVLSGPNAGKTIAATTSASGSATFTYASAASGTDTVQATFTDASGNTINSNSATVTWTSTTTVAPTQVTTSLSAGSQHGLSVSVPVGTAVTDAAALTGTNAASATGTVRYTVFSDAACTNAVTTGSAETITTAGDLPASSPVTLGSPGTYYWQASYSGDSHNGPSTSVCGPTGEVETVVKASPKVVTIPSATVPVGGVISDSATLANSYSPTGSITFKLYGPGDTTCAGTPLETVTKALGIPSTSSGSFQVTAAGTYSWVASYSGDPDNNSATSACGTETVVVTPQVLTGDAFAVQVHASLLGLPLINPATVQNTGAVSTTSSTSTAVPCGLKVAVVNVLLSGEICGDVTTDAAYPSRSTASASVANIALGLPTLPVIAIEGVRSTSTTTCSGSVGSTTIAYLRVGTTVVIAKPTTVPANDTMHVGPVTLILNQQLPFSSPDHGLTVNAIHVLVGLPWLANLDLTVASSESDIANCP
jgi:hypothetical protein